MRRLLARLWSGLFPGWRRRSRRSGRHAVAPVAAAPSAPDAASRTIVVAPPSQPMMLRRSNKPRLVAVDPDPEVLNFIAAAAGQWYRVIAARDGGWARAWLGQYDDIVALVTSEQVRETKGVDLLQRCQQVKPGALRVLVTGNVDSAEMVKALLTGVAHRLVESPMGPENFGAAIDPARVKDMVEAASITQRPRSIVPRRKRLAA